jgi:hypothetical protein
MKVFKDGVQISTKNIYESNNFGYVNQPFGKGVYKVMFKISEWHADEVPDYSFRLYFPIAVTIKQQAYVPPVPANSPDSETLQVAKNSISTLAYSTNGIYGLNAGFWGEDEYLA